jgi:hypothetical protein
MTRSYESQTCFNARYLFRHCEGFGLKKSVRRQGVRIASKAHNFEGGGILYPSGRLRNDAGSSCRPERLLRLCEGFGSEQSGTFIPENGLLRTFAMTLSPFRCARVDMTAERSRLFRQRRGKPDMTGCYGTDGMTEETKGEIRFRPAFRMLELNII